MIVAVITEVDDIDGILRYWRERRLGSLSQQSRVATPARTPAKRPLDSRLYVRLVCVHSCAGLVNGPSLQPGTPRLLMRAP